MTTTHTGRAAAIAGVLVAGSLLAGCTGGSPAPAPTSSASSSQETVIAAMLQNGIRLAGEQRYDDASNTFKAILAIDPTDEYALYNLGLIAQIRGEDDQAISYYQQAIETDPRFTSAMYNEAILREASDRAQAESIYRQIIAIDPRAATAFLRLSFLYRADGETEKADAARASALALDPSLAGATPSPVPGK